MRKRPHGVPTNSLYSPGRRPLSVSREERMASHCPLLSFAFLLTDKRGMKPWSTGHSTPVALTEVSLLLHLHVAGFQLDAAGGSQLHNSACRVCSWDTALTSRRKALAACIQRSRTVSMSGMKALLIGPNFNTSFWLSQCSGYRRVSKNCAGCWCIPFDDLQSQILASGGLQDLLEFWTPPLTA